MPPTPLPRSAAATRTWRRINKQGECGTGAVVPWADRLWVITYAPHKPEGSDDKLYEIDAELNRTVRPESVGGTPADRMIHKESNQLVIGPYFIDKERNVRVIPPTKMPGRLTAAARHLTDPANRLYLLDMEGMLYDVDAHTLDVKKLFARMAPGAHCKGGYTGQGRLVMSNNGNIVANKAKPAADDPGYAKDPEAAGVLAEWDGKTWTHRRAPPVHRHHRPRRHRRLADRPEPALGARLGQALGDAQAARWRQVVDLPPARRGLFLCRQTRLVHRVAAHPRSRQRQVADEHARRVVRLPQNLLRLQHRRHPPHRHLPQNHRRLLPLERPARLRLR